MSIVTVESTLTPKYLRNKTKDELISICMMLLEDKCRFERQSQNLTEAVTVAIRKLSIYKGDEDNGCAQSACDILERALK